MLVFKHFNEEKLREVDDGKIFTESDEDIEFSLRDCVCQSAFEKLKKSMTKHATMVLIYWRLYGNCGESRLKITYFGLERLYVVVAHPLVSFDGHDNVALVLVAGDSGALSDHLANLVVRKGSLGLRERSHAPNGSGCVDAVGRGGQSEGASVSGQADDEFAFRSAPLFPLLGIGGLRKRQGLVYSSGVVADDADFRSVGRELESSS